MKEVSPQPLTHSGVFQCIETVILSQGHRFVLHSNNTRPLLIDILKFVNGCLRGHRVPLAESGIASYDQVVSADDRCKFACPLV